MGQMRRSSFCFDLVINIRCVVVGDVEGDWGSLSDGLRARDWMLDVLYLSTVSPPVLYGSALSCNHES